ncbi:MAG: hypothetical protein N3A38_05110 [Planctomycetota bacterium]|nr:hypothetical protein [Planctomycetota bacterium]
MRSLRVVLPSIFTAGGKTAGGDKDGKSGPERGSRDEKPREEPRLTTRELRPIAARMAELAVRMRDGER